MFSGLGAGLSVPAGFGGMIFGGFSEDSFGFLGVSVLPSGFFFSSGSLGASGFFSGDLSGGGPTSSSTGVFFSSGFGCTAVCSGGWGCRSRKGKDASPAAAASNTAPPTAATIFRLVVLNQPSLARPKASTPARAAAIPPLDWPLYVCCLPDLVGFAAVAARAGVFAPLEAALAVDGAARKESKSSAGAAESLQGLHGLRHAGAWSCRRPRAAKAPGPRSPLASIGNGSPAPWPSSACRSRPTSAGCRAARGECRGAPASDA